MSPSWRDTLRLEIDPAEVRVRRFSRGWRPRLVAERREPIAGAAPQAAVEALATVLGTHTGRRAAAHVVLSGDRVHFAVQEGAARLRGAAERQAAARHALRRVYGDVAVQWRASETLSAHDTLLVAGVETALYEGIVAVLQAAGATIESVQPALCVALNRCRPWLVSPAWLVAAEPGRAHVGYCDGTGLVSLRSHRLRLGLGQDLSPWLQQARLLDGLGGPDVPIVLAQRDAGEIRLEGVEAPVRFVDLSQVA